MHVLDARQCPPQLGQVLDLEREPHVRQVVAALRAHRRDVNALARERIADVAQQALPVVRRDRNLDRIAAAGLRAPTGLDETLGRGSAAR